MDEKKIEQLSRQIREATEARAARKSEAETLMNSMREAGADLNSADNRTKINDAYRAADSAAAEVENLRGALDAELGRVIERGADRAAAVRGSLGEQFIQGEVYKNLQARGILNSGVSPIGNLHPTEVLSRDAMVQGARLRQFDNSADVGSGLLTPDYQALLIEQYRRQVRLLDLFNTTTTNTDTVDWVVENEEDVNAAETPYGTALPESNFGFSHAQTSVTRVGHHTVATRGILADAGRSRNLIDTRLLSGLRRRLESQTLGGNGVGANIKGILAYTGEFLTRPLGSDTKLDAVHKAMTDIRVATEGDVEPQHLLIHPLDYEELVLDKDSTGVYRFGSPVNSLKPSIWGLTPIVTTLVAAGSPLVADFGQAATLWTREGISIAASDQHSDFFLKGLVAIKAETRVAFALVRPKAVVVMSGM